MELKKYNSDFLVDNKIRKNKTGANKDKLNNRSFLTIFNETIKENNKIKVSKEETLRKLQFKEQNVFEKMQEKKCLGCNKMEMKKRIDSAVRKLADFFGIGESWMRLILQSAGINPEELIDEDKRAIILKILSKFLLLNEKKEKELEKLLKTL